MKIKIAERLAPFSHANGTKFLLPRTTIVAQIFPTRIFFTDIEDEMSPFHADFPFAGPVKEFTAQLDLEKGLLRVFGKTAKGFMRYVVQAKPEGISIAIEKGSKPVPRIPVALPLSPHEMPRERLSLGSHKAQDWEAVHRRLDFVEIFPLWHRMGAWSPEKKCTAKAGNFSLLEDCRETIAACDKTKVLEAFERFFLSAFDGVLVPRLNDTEFQGIVKDGALSGVSPLPLLTEGGKLIRSMFIQESPETIAILPCLPPQFHCGRMTDVQTSNGCLIDMEWTKKSLRQMRVSSPKDCKVQLILPKGIVSYRKAKKKKLSVDETLILSLSAGETVHLDRFER